MTVYDRIRQLRISKKMTQTDLAEKLGYKDGSMITKIESGKVDISQKKLVAFANALDTTPAYLMGWIDTEEISFSERLSVDENHIIMIYRSLPTKGKEYLIQQAQIASITFGEKPQDVSDEAVR